MSGSPESFTLEGTPSSAVAGEVAAWVFIAANATALLLIGVNATAVVSVGLVSGCSSVSEYAALGAIAGLSVVNQSVVAASFNENGGTTFASSHGVNYEAFVLFGNSSDFYGDAAWGVFYSTCGISQTTGSGTALIAAYNAESGSALSSPAKESMSC